MNDFIFNADLLEYHNSWYFSIDSRDQREYLLKKKRGLLQRHFNAHRLSKSIELNNLQDAKQHISHPRLTSLLKYQNDEISLNPSRLLRENEPVLNALREINPQEWKVIFRTSDTYRVILEKGLKGKKNHFTHYSILVKIRLKDHRQFIEIGEGSVTSPKFNQSGLSQRIKKIVENHIHSKPVRFTGKIPVILNAGDGAIIFHELLGHSLEADYICQHQSPLSIDDIGKQIMSKNITITTHDDADSFFKGITCDDEGHSPESHILVEKGILRHVISDYFYMNRLNIKDSGHSRLEDFTKKPMPRMFALYVKPGEYHPDELIASTKYGVYALEFGEGKVNFEKNLFYFHIREAWIIKDGKLSEPLGSIIVKGNILDVLKSVEMVANDFRYDKGISYCFKNGQTLNVRVGQPTVKINNLYVTREFGF